MKESTRFPSLPIPSKEFVKNPGQATKGQIKIYQEKTGTVLYIAVTTRPDIARALSVLSKFITNPSDKHIKAINQTILYLYATRFLTIEFSAKSDDILFIASDTSFTDDTDTRHSSQGYIITLFGGPVV